MGPAVIGAGWGRTGTTSLRLALEKLGFGPCYHWTTVRPEHVPAWRAAVSGGEVDWDALLGSYGAAVDWPASHFWRELAERYPDAKLILSTRDADAWFDSASETIYRMLSLPLSTFDGSKNPGWDAESMQEFIRISRRVCIEEALGAPFEESPHTDRARATARFAAHVKEVVESVPASRLLVYEVSQGWEPLCAFLDRPIPSEEFPRKNDRDRFAARIDRDAR